MTWQWDETLFAGAAPYYERGRLPYAPALADAMAAALGLDGKGRLLDAGCGPGTVTLRLAHLFEEVVGLDADAGMLEEAARLAAEQGVTNARWVHLRAEELPAGLGIFRVITFAASFHWMDRPKVASAALQMLEPGGALVHVDNHQHDFDNSDLPYPPVPAAALVDLIRRYLGPDKRAGQSVRNTSPGDEDDVFRAAGFVGLRRVHVPDGRILTRTIDDIVAGNYSVSASAPHLFGEHIEEYEQEQRWLLARQSPSGLFAVRLPDNELKIWTPGKDLAGSVRLTRTA